MKEYFKSITSLKQRKIIGILNNTYLNFPVNPVNIPLVQLKSINKRVDLTNSSLLEKEIKNKFKPNFHFAFEISEKVNSQLTLSNMTSLISNLHIGITFTNLSMEFTSLKDNIGCFYLNEFENSFFISEGRKFVEITNDLNEFRFKIFLKNGLINENFSINRQSINNYVQNINYISKYISLYPGDIFVSKEFDIKQIQNLIFDENNKNDEFYLNISKDNEEILKYNVKVQVI